MDIASRLITTAHVFTTTLHYLRLAHSSEAKISELKIKWAKAILSNLNVEVRKSGEVCPDPSMLFVGNHISYLDIPLLMLNVPDVSFVAKKEVGAWPVFGGAARKIDTIFVKRRNGQSRVSAKEAIVEGLDSGKRIVVFPSGTTCMHESKPWRYGAFQIAEIEGCMVQPFRLIYSPLRAAAYIDRDFFPHHLYKMGGEEKIVAHIEFHAPVQVKDAAKDAQYWQNWSRGLHASEVS